ncbi:MAG: hypothetical protein ACI4HI_00455 [Lachnospiraceae bacterium]
MKKIFHFIGILLSIFSIFYFLLVADKLVYITKDPVYDFTILGNSITLKEIESIAKETDEMLYVRNYGEYDFGNNHITYTLLNAPKDLQEGKQKSIFPKEKRIYQKTNLDLSKHVTDFTLQTQVETKKKQVEKILTESGYRYRIDTSNPGYSFSDMINTNNIRFFCLLFLFSMLCILTYYASRSKKMGILKLNGWSSARVSFSIMWEMYIQTLKSSFFVMGGMCIYILVMQKERLAVYIKISMWLLEMLSVVYVLAAFLASPFIRRMDLIASIKQKKNRKMIFAGVFLVKSVMTAFLLFGMRDLGERIYIAYDSIQAQKAAESQNLYLFDSDIVQKDASEKMNQFLQTIPDSQVYNYAPPETEYTKLNILKKKLPAYDPDYLEENFMIFSENMLSMIDVRDENGARIRKMHLKKGQECICIPQHYKKYTKEIMELFQEEKDTKVQYIQDGQTYADLSSPGLYGYDSILFLHGVEKGTSLNIESVFYKEDVVAEIKKQMHTLNVDKCVNLNPLEYTTKLSVSNNKLEIWQNGIYFVLNILSYLLAAVSSLLIYLEFQKKKIGVYRLMGKIPWKALSLFPLMNLLITVFLILWISNVFWWFAVLEILLCLCMMQRYSRKKAVNSIRGE